LSEYTSSKYIFLAAHAALYVLVSQVGVGEQKKLNSKVFKTA